MRSLTSPTGDLCDSLRVNRRDAADCGERACTVSNFQLRLFVAGWMLDDGCGFVAAAKLALSLYQRYRPGLIDAEGHLTDASIAREVMMLVDQWEQEQ